MLIGYLSVITAFLEVIPNDYISFGPSILFQWKDLAHYFQGYFSFMFFG